MPLTGWEVRVAKPWIRMPKPGFKMYKTARPCMVFMAGAVVGYEMQPSMVPPRLSPSAFGQKFESPRDDDTHLSWLQQTVKTVDDSPDSAVANQVGEYFGFAVQQDWQAMLDRVDTDDIPSEAAHILRGIALSGMKKHAEAIRCFDAALKINPESAIVFIYKIHALNMLNHHDEAMECIDRALKTNSDDPFYHNLKGVLLADTEKHEPALACFDTALTLDPESKTIPIHKGLILEQLDRDEEAAVCYDAVLKADPAHRDALVHKGVVLTKLDRYADAVECYDRVLERYPDDVQAHLYKEYALLFFGKISACGNQL